MNTIASTPGYVVPKTGIRASVLLRGQPPRTVELFLGDRARSHEGAERAGDLLCSDASFIPVRHSDTGEVFLLRRDAVMVLTVAAEGEAPDGEPEALLLRSEAATSVVIEIVLADGSSIRGEVAYVMPEGRRRLQDFLNLPERVFRLRQEGRIHIVSKSHIAEVHILEPARRA